MTRPHVVVAALAFVTVSCATARPADEPPLFKERLKVDKWFTVVASRAVAGDPCRLDVLPDYRNAPVPRPPGGSPDAVPPDSPDRVKQGDTRVNPGWTVAWTLINLCNTTQSLSLAFNHEAQGPKAPIAFRSFANRVLIGTVRSRPYWIFFKKCQAATGDAPCGRYKYTVTVGDLTLDPEIEIVEYH